jgi:hypothetical protein
VAGAELVWEKNTAGWLAASQPNKALMAMCMCMCISRFRCWKLRLPSKKKSF